MKTDLAIIMGEIMTFKNFSRVVLIHKTSDVCFFSYRFCKGNTIKIKYLSWFLISTTFGGFEKRKFRYHHCILISYLITEQSRKQFLTFIITTLGMLKYIALCVNRHRTFSFFPLFYSKQYYIITSFISDVHYYYSVISNF